MCSELLWAIMVGFLICFSRLNSSVVGVAAVDFDGDGWVDILTVEEFSGQVYWYNEDGFRGIYIIMLVFCVFVYVCV